MPSPSGTADTPSRAEGRTGGQDASRKAWIQVGHEFAPPLPTLDESAGFGDSGTSGGSGRQGRAGRLGRYEEAAAERLPWTHRPGRAVGASSGNRQDSVRASHGKSRSVARLATASSAGPG